MNLKCRLILEDYRKQRDGFVKLGDVVHGMLIDITEQLGIDVLAVEHRVKAEKSLAGKLERKGDSYATLDDITDILGCRIVCFLADEIDKIGHLIEERFVIDWENTSDKRAIIKEDSFGYLSLHYICSLPFNSGFPDEICGKRFEVQIKTVLQHAWSVIQHDIGYKSDFGVPRDIKRQFARLAGLLELADDEFVRARDNMVGYTEDIRRRIITDDADDVVINMISLSEYVLHNKKMQSLIKEIADISSAEINDIDPESYIPQLAFLGITRLGDIERMISENHDLAIRLAEQALSGADLDIVSSSVALRFLCRAELLNKGYDFERIVEFLKISLKSGEKAERQAKHLMRQNELIKKM